MATVQSFRNDFPEFINSQTYPDASINFWLTLGTSLLNSCVWGDMLNHGLELFTAHHMTMQQQNYAAAANGAAPGQNTGIVSGKTVDKVSITYDTTAGVLENAGHYALTSYGQQFIYLTRLLGAGGLQTGGCWSGPAYEGLYYLQQGANYI